MVQTEPDRWRALVSVEEEREPMRRHVTRLLLMPYAIVAAGCNLLLGPPIRCLPLAPLDCDRHVAEIQAMLTSEFPDWRAFSIEFANEEGDAMIRLDDGTDIGWGGSDGPRRGD
jgi:hypothetical protein